MHGKWNSGGLLRGAPGTVSLEVSARPWPPERGEGIARGIYNRLEADDRFSIRQAPHEVR